MRKREEVTLAPMTLVVEHKTDLCAGLVVVRTYINEDGYMVVVPKCSTCGVRGVVDYKVPL